jgi:hypothetical protein
MLESCIQVVSRLWHTRLPGICVKHLLLMSTLKKFGNTSNCFTCKTDRALLLGARNRSEYDLKSYKLGVRLFLLVTMYRQ